MEDVENIGEEGVRSWRIWEEDGIETIGEDMALITTGVHILCSSHFCFPPDLLNR